MATGPATVRLSRLSEAQPPEAEIPSQVGSVRLVKQIGKGGMGVVWLAHHEILGRDVAVKFVLSATAPEPTPAPDAGPGVSEAAAPAVTRPDELQAFIEGCRAAAAVRHEGLVEVYHADLVNGIPYLVMEYVDGPSLEAVLRRLGSLSLPLCLAIMEVTCNAVAELHDAGIIHRDIKPANLLLSPEGRIEVTDFGLACERPNKGKDVGLAGTPVYMAPEMFEGQISLKSDVYALGITLFELLTGSVPFDGSPEIVHVRHRDDPLPVEALAARQVPPLVGEAIERATAKNPMLRSRTARHVLQALRQAVRDEDVWNLGRRELTQLTSRWRSAPEDEGAEAPSTATYYEHISMRAERKRRSTPLAPPAGAGSPAEAPLEADLSPEEREQEAPETAPALAADVSQAASAARANSVREHVPCVECGRDLFASSVGESCPECSVSVSLSLAPERLCFADRAWLTRLRAGLAGFFLWAVIIAAGWLIAGSTLYAVLVSNGIVPRRGPWQLPWPYPWLVAAWLLGLRACVVCALAFAMPREPGPAATPLRRVPARARSLALVLVGVGALLGLGADALRLAQGPDVAPLAAQVIRASSWLQFAFGAGALAGLSWWLSRLFASMPSLRRASRARSAIFLCVSAAAATAAWGVAGSPAGVSPWATLLATLVLLLLLAALVRVLALAWRARADLVLQLDPSLRPAPPSEEEE